MAKNKKDKISYSTETLIKNFSIMKENRDHNPGGGLFGMMWDKGNKKAVSTYAGESKYEDKTYILSVNEPFKIMIKEFDDFLDFKKLLRRYKVGFEEKMEIDKPSITDN